MALQDPASFASAKIISRQIDLRVLELLTARLCHELSGPVAAINNGIELLSEEGADLLGEAVPLVSDSARRAAARLRFFRFAYGYSERSANAGPAPHEVATGFFAENRIVFDYPADARLLPLDWQQLACNLLAVARDALPRGGRLALTARPLAVEAVGEAVLLSPEMRVALALETPSNELTARTVHPYFTALLALALGRRLIATSEPGRLRLAAIADGV